MTILSIVRAVVNGLITIVETGMRVSIYAVPLKWAGWWGFVVGLAGPLGLILLAEVIHR